MPIWKLQVVGGTVFDFLHEQTGKGGTITLKYGVAYKLRQLFGLIAELLKVAWTRQVRQCNLNELGDTAGPH